MFSPKTSLERSTAASPSWSIVSIAAAKLAATAAWTSTARAHVDSASMARTSIMAPVISSLRMGAPRDISLYITGSKKKVLWLAGACQQARKGSHLRGHRDGRPGFHGPVACQHIRSQFGDPGAPASRAAGERVHQRAAKRPVLHFDQGPRPAIG